MELWGSLPNSQDSTTCHYPSQINPFLYPSHFWQVQIVSFLVGLRTYQHPVTNPLCRYSFVQVQCEITFYGVPVLHDTRHIRNKFANEAAGSGRIIDSSMWLRQRSHPGAANYSGSIQKFIIWPTPKHCADFSVILACIISRTQLHTPSLLQF
jgi:hypothetical protein